MLLFLAVLKDTAIFVLFLCLFVPFCFSLQVAEPQTRLTQHRGGEGVLGWLTLKEYSQPCLQLQLKEHVTLYQSMPLNT